MEIKLGMKCWFIPEGFEVEIVRVLVSGDKVTGKINGLSKNFDIFNGVGFEINKLRMIKHPKPGSVALFPVATQNELIPLGHYDS